MKNSTFIFFVLSIISSISSLEENPDQNWMDSLERSMIKELLKCTGTEYKNVTMAAYYPIYDDEVEENGNLDVRGNDLQSLQEFLDGQSEYVTVAMDSTLQIPYGTPVCIPELNEFYARRIIFQVRDSGSNLRGKKYKRVDICVRSEADSYDRHVNRLVTLVF